MIELGAALVAAKSVGWVTIPRFGGYLFGDAGEIMSLRGPKPRVLKAGTRGVGYRGATLIRDDGTYESVYVHRVIAEAFYGDISHEDCVRHLDGDRANNDILNLLPGSHADNMRDMRRHGRSCVGTRNAMSSLKESDVRKIRALKSEGVKQVAIARMFGVSPMTVSRIVNNQLWKHIL